MKKKLFALILTISILPVFAAHRVVWRPAIVRTSVRVPMTVTSTVHVVYPHGQIDINCNKKNADVFVDGSYAGKAGQFDGFPGKLSLKPGTYRLKIVSGITIKTFNVKVIRGHELNLNVSF